MGEKQDGLARLSLRRQTDHGKDVQRWTVSQRRAWCAVLFVGTMILYATRNSLPLCAVEIGRDMHWDKHLSGIILSVFYFGYILTQVLGGWLADRSGGEHVLWMAAVGWSVLTILLPWVTTSSGLGTGILRLVTGMLQGVHYPAMNSLLTQRIVEAERSVYYGIVLAGAHTGTVFVGSVGSFLAQHYTWLSVFVVFGLAGLFWSVFVRLGMIATLGKFSWNVGSVMLPSSASQSPLPWLGHESKAPADSAINRMLSANGLMWIKICTQLPILSIFAAHFCNNTVLTVLASWLPTYFHDSFPQAQPGIYNTVPWVLLAVSCVGSGYVANHLISLGYSLGFVRKSMEAVSLAGPAVFLFLLGYFVHSFGGSLLCMSASLACHGFSTAGVLSNPSDVAPQHAGSLFGVMNMVGALPGILGVYTTGHILHTTGSWMVVFHMTASVCVVGLIIFTLFGTARKLL